MTARGRTEWQKFVDDKLKDHDKRLSDAEKNHAVYEALAQEQKQYLQERFNRTQDNITATRLELAKEVNAIKSGVNKLLWAVGIIVATAIVRWILNGGLAGL